MSASGETGSAARCDLETRVAFDQLTLVFLGLRPIAWVVPTISLMTAITFSGWVAWPKLASWVGLVVAGSITKKLAIKRFLGRAALPPREIAYWNRLCSLACAAHGIAWVSMAYFLWLPGNDLNHCVIILILGCTVGSILTFHSASRPLTLTTFLVYGLPFLVTPLFGEERTFHFLPLIIGPYLGFLAYIANRAHREARRILLLRYEHDELLVRQHLLIKQLDAARAEAESANHAKSQFLANMSHELRTPLTAIMGFSEIIKARIRGDNVERNIEYAGLIHASGQHLLSLINDILDLAKIEAGSFQLVEQPIDLGELIGESMKLMEHRAHAGACSLAEAVEPGLPAVRADHRALKQIFLNLLSNAIKFTPPGGSVRAFARQLTDGGISFGVTDTGVGIAPEDQSRVFEKFGQGRHAFAPKEKGTGLGLSVVRALVEMHGGEVLLASALGSGTTVTVVFPTCRVVSDVGQAGTWQASGPRSGLGAG
jgi:two-component system cell cycle sensor histidine kinase PleC